MKFVDIVAKKLNKIADENSFYHYKILLYWDLIAPQYKSIAFPVGIKFPYKSRSNGALEIGVFNHCDILKLKMQEIEIIHKANSYLGGRRISRLGFRNLTANEVDVFRALHTKSNAEKIESSNVIENLPESVE